MFLSDSTFDSALDLLREGYDFIWNDAGTHQHHEAALVRLTTPAQMKRLMDETSQSWRRSIARWEKQIRPFVLFDEVRCLLAEAVCNWADIPLGPVERKRRTRDLAHMVDAFSGLGPRLWRGKLARGRAERWIARLIERARRGELRPDPDSALHVMAHHRDLDGKLLEAKPAAVELLDILRPTIASAWYVAFAALALHQQPEARGKLAREPIGEGTGEYAARFMQEVRRTADLGQLAGEATHPGIPTHQLTLALHFLTRCMRYEVLPHQDLRIDRTRSPALPKSGVVIRNVRATAALHLAAPRLPSASAARDVTPSQNHAPLPPATRDMTAEP